MPSAVGHALHASTRAIVGGGHRKGSASHIACLSVQVLRAQAVLEHLLPASEINSWLASEGDMVDAQDLDSLFQGTPRGPLRRVLGSCDESQPWRGAFGAIVIGWLPLALLATMEALYAPSVSWTAFWSDFAVHARFLVAAPILVAANLLCGHRLGRIAHQLMAGGVVRAEDSGRYTGICATTRRLRNAMWTWLVAVGLAYAATLFALHLLPAELLPSWHHRHGWGYGPYSLSGWWHALVSFPLLLVLLIHWFWRLGLWAAFLYRVSRLRLNIIAAHPDGAGGLGFTGQSVPAFTTIGFSLGAMVAGTIANRVVHQGYAFAANQMAIAAIAVIAAILFVAPLLVFAPRLHSSRTRGVWHYGALARHLGSAFETRWLNRADMEIDALSEPDFCSLTDLYSIVERVHRMRVVPVRPTSIIVLEIATLAPFAPIALLGIPADVVIERLLSVLLGAR